MKASDSSDQSATMGRPSLYRRLATSQERLPRLLRSVRRSVQRIGVPAPRVIVRPILWLFLGMRTTYHFLARVCICEPLFKAYCTKYGRNLHTGESLHWVTGKGRIILGDNVCFDGKTSIGFGARFADYPTLEVGDNTGIGHGCQFTIGKRVSIGSNTTISGGTLIMDSNGHSVDPVLRWQNSAPAEEDVRPVVIGDGVWIGLRCIIFPGVKIGDGSVVSAGSVVRSHVPPYSVVAGNPAKVMFRLKKPDQLAWEK